MREVLFRGKFLCGKWVEGLPYEVDGVIDCIRVKEQIQDIISYTTYKVIPETLGQYTGLTDKNGKKIFEGDILQVITGDGWSCPKGTKVYYEVVFTEFNPENASWSEYIGYMAKGERGALRSLANVIRRYDAVVIGTIHDNPELLKGGENNG